MYLVVSNKRFEDRVDSRATYRVLPLKVVREICLDPSKEVLVLHGTFPTEEEAIEEMNRIVRGGLVAYTRLLYNRGFPLDEIPENDRYFLAYLGEDLTTIPGLYPMAYHDYSILETHFPRTRLPSPRELEDYEEPEDPEGEIPVTQGTFRKLEGLDLQEVTFEVQETTLDRFMMNPLVWIVFAIFFYSLFLKV